MSTPHVSFGHHALGDNSTIFFFFFFFFFWVTGQFHDLIDICLAWQFSLPGYESKRVHGCIIADLCFSTHMCHDMIGLS